MQSCKIGLRNALYDIAHAPMNFQILCVRTISLAEPDFHSSESGSARLLNHCQGL